MNNYFEKNKKKILFQHLQQIPLHSSFQSPVRMEIGSNRRLAQSKEGQGGSVEQDEVLSGTSPTSINAEFVREFMTTTRQYIQRQFSSD